MRESRPKIPEQIRKNQCRDQGFDRRRLGRGIVGLTKESEWEGRKGRGVYAYYLLDRGAEEEGRDERGGHGEPDPPYPLLLLLLLLCYRQTDREAGEASGFPILQR